MAKKSRKPLPLKFKRFLLQALSIVFILAPVSVVVGLNWEKYAPKEVEKSGWTTSFGLIFSVVIVVILLMRKAKPDEKQEQSPVKVLLISTALAWLLDPLISDIKIILSAATAGALIDYVILNPIIDELNETIKMTKQAKIHAKAMAEVDRGR